MPKPKKTESAKPVKPAPTKTAPAAKKSTAARKLDEAKAALTAVKAAVVDAIPTTSARAKKPAQPAKTKPTTAPATAAKKPAATKSRKEKLPVAHITNEDIGLRAYYIGEHRQAHGLEGDSATDWIEAERQLRAEG